MSTDGLEEFEQVRTRLFRVACRTVGNPQEAEDLVQDVWERWQRTDRTAVVDPGAFLVTAVSRLAINVVQSARRRHETPAGPWLPVESASSGVDPQTHVEQQEAFDLAVRVLLDRLSPAERATYVLREGFEYPYREIAATLRIGAPNARQLVKRARDRLSSERLHPARRPDDRSATPASSTAG